MTSMTGLSPAGMQASAAVFNVDASTKPAVQKRDDVVAAIDTTNGQATKADISLLKMSDSSVGQNLDIQI